MGQKTAASCAAGWHAAHNNGNVIRVSLRATSEERDVFIRVAYILGLWYTFFQSEEKRMSVTQMTQKGQILVPKHLRRKLGLKPGGKVHLDEEEGRLVLTPVPPDPIEAATGFLKGRFSLTQDLRREHREEARRERKARPR
jgi:AbrB family looped-hinge helix DNA binding protein